MSAEATPDQKFQIQANEDAANARRYGLIFIIAGFALQILHFFKLPLPGFTAMLIVAAVILIGAGILFILGSYTVPQNRTEFIRRFQNTMLDHNPERRLWAAQRLVGYVREANFTKDEILDVARHAAKMVKNPDVSERYKPYVAVDHIILLRELAVNVEMDKHVRKDFIRVVKPLTKMEGLSDDAYEVLSDAIAYHPDKLPIQAYSDLRKQKDESGRT